MRRTSLFLLFIVVVVLATISTVDTFLPHQMMMGRMMGTNYGAVVGFLWLLVLISSTTTMVAAYVIAFPSIRYSSAAEKNGES